MTASPATRAPLLARAAAWLVGPSAMSVALAQSSAGVATRVTAPFAQLAPSILTDLTVARVKTALLCHEQGDFSQTAQIAEHMLRDADVQQALAQRVEGLLGCPFTLKPADESPAAAAHAAEVTALWPRIAPRAVLSDALRSVVQMGFFAARVHQDWREDRGCYVPRLDPWFAEHVAYAPWEDRWYAHTLQGRELITPGRGWVLWTPFSPRRSFQYGVVRALPNWFLRAQFASKDASRWSEVKGQGVWLAKLPGGASTTPAGAAFTASVRRMGRAGVVELPQGDTPQKSYGLDLVESKSDGWQGFDFLLRMSARKIRLAICGQDMTSESGPAGGSYAQSKVGDGVRQDIKEADAASLADVLREQVGEPFALYRAGDRNLAARACWDATPPKDLAARSAALEGGARAVKGWREVGWDPDVEALAKEYGVPGKRLAAPPAPTPAPPTSAAPAAPAAPRAPGPGEGGGTNDEAEEDALFEQDAAETST